MCHDLGRLSGVWKQTWEGGVGEEHVGGGGCEDALISFSSVVSSSDGSLCEGKSWRGVGGREPPLDVTVEASLSSFARRT